MSSLPNLNTASSLNVTTNGFWEIGNYKANVQRIHHGSDQLDELSRFIKERMNIENNYAKQLERWNDEWNHYSEKHLPDGSMKRSFGFILDESKELAKVHSSVKDRFNDEVLKTIELFKRDNYHRSTFRGFREAKEVEDEFEKAQKQWKKLFEKVELTKRAYHSAARTEKSTYIQYMNTKTDNAQTDGTEAKARERFEKCHKEVKRAKSAYEQMLKEMTSYNGIYMENMAFVFEKCQQIEMKRLRFALEMLSGMQKILVDLVNPPKIAQLHAKFRQHFLSMTDATIGEDLKRWSLFHGVDCSTNWPRFEEYNAELRHFTGPKSRRIQQKEKQQTETGVVLTKKVVKDEDESPQNGRISFDHSSVSTSHHEEIGSVDEQAENDAVVDAEGIDSAAVNAEGIDSAAVDSEGIDSAAVNAEGIDSAAVDSEGIDSAATVPPPLSVGPAKALYDYEPIEGDEIKLVKGELLKIISGPDNLGWCFGEKKDGSTGLFPAGYVLPLAETHR